jgi:hypothetical protein
MEATCNSENNNKEIKPLNWTDLCFVRALDNPGLQLKLHHGQLISQTPIDSSRGEIPRITNHFAVNHFVQQHMTNSWAGSGAVLLCPGETTVALNGKPENLHAVDTFWSNDITIPDNSFVIWLKDPPKNIEIPENIHSVAIKLPDAKLLELEKIETSINNKIFDSADDLMLLENRASVLSEEIQDIISQIVNNQLKQMGYPVFWGDNGTYMHQPGVDKAISDLTRREGIKTSATHANTPMGILEIGEGWTMYPLLELGTLSDEKLFTKNDEGVNRFSKILSQVNNTLDLFTEPLSKGEEKELNVFSAELYIKLIKKGEIMDDENIQYLIGEICSKSKLIKDNLRSWSEKDKNPNSKKVLLFTNQEVTPVSH